MDDYAHDYRILGVAPGCSLHVLKAARRRLVKSWHPDRHLSGSDTRRHAEERIKDINTAFDRLTQYYANFGVLPSLIEPPLAPAPSAPPAEPVSGENRHPVRSRASLRWVIVLITIGLTAEALHVLRQEPHPDATEPAALTPVSATSPAIPEAPHNPVKYFTVGSSLGEVYAAQGVPTLIENGVWHYGKSKVYFKAGAVISWEHDSANPLNATVLPHDTARNPNVFTVGSTKAEVRAIQGAPLLETDALWDYGLSKVYFRDNVVAGWDSSPMLPLRARR
jgi:hypothetical protein